MGEKMRKRASLPETKKLGRLDDVVWAPIKILGKARDLYMKGIEDCVGKTGLDAVLVAGGPSPAGFGGSRSGGGGGDGEEFVVREGLRLSSKRRSDRVPAERRRVRRPEASGRRGRGRGRGVVLGRIDEDAACCFGEDVNVETFLLGPRNGTKWNPRTV